MKDDSSIHLDLSSTFDTVDHKKLIDKHEHYGVRKKSLEMVTLYLENQIKELEEEVNKSKLVKIQVPQGLILGPILFITFTNDVINYITNKTMDIDIAVYVDDTNACLLHADGMAAPNARVYESLVSFQILFLANNLIISVTKTNIILF